LAGALLFGIAIAAREPARAEFCPDAAGFKSMSEDWMMAKVCDLVHETVSGAAKDVLSDLGKGALRAVLNSYVPGLGGLIFGEADPFAADAQRIIDQIKQSEKTILSTTVAHLDDLMRAMIDQHKMDRRAGFMALLHEWEAWNDQDWNGKADQHEEIVSISNAINELRWAVQGQIATQAADSTMTPPYPYLSLLHEWTLLMALQFQAESQQIQWAAVSKVYPQGSLLSQDDVRAKFNANPDIQASVDRELKLSWSRLYGEADTFMNDLSNIAGSGRSIFLEDMKWNWPWVVPSSHAQLGERSSALPDVVPCAACNSIPGWYSGGIKVFSWKDRYWSKITYVNDRWCGWLPVHDSLVYNGIWSETRDAPLCSPQPAEVPYNPQTPNPAAATDRSIYQATKRVYDYIAAHNPEYATMLLAGYGPVRVALDHWWEGARKIGAVNGYRPLNGLDTQLDELLWSTDPVVSRFAWNDDIRASFGQAVDNFYGLCGSTPSSLEERSLFIGFALEYGTAALGQIAWTAYLYDHDHYTQRPDGTASYPIALHEYYVLQRENSPDAMLKYYRAESDAVWLAMQKHRAL
jgi:hypothetical protein